MSVCAPAPIMKMVDRKEVIYSELKAQLPDLHRPYAGFIGTTQIEILDDHESNWILIQACYDNELKIIKHFYNSKKTISKLLPKLSKTAMHVAASQNKTSYFSYLCDIYDYRVNYADPDDTHFTHFRAVCQMGHEVQARLMINSNVVDDFNRLLSDAVLTYKPKSSIVRYLLLRAEDREQTDTDGNNLLSRFCLRCCTMMIDNHIELRACLDVLQVMLQYGCQPNAINNHGITPVLNLFYHGLMSPELQKEALRILVHHRANVRHFDNDYQTILHYMVSRQNWFRDKIFEVERPDHFVLGLLSSIVKFSGISLRHTEKLNRSPLDCAISYCNFEAVVALVALGANPSVASFTGGFLDPNFGCLRNFEMTLNMLDIVSFLRVKNVYFSSAKQALVLRFLLGFSTINTIYDPDCVMALAPNASTIASYCSILMNSNHRKDQMIAAIQKHVAIVKLGGMYMNSQTESYLKELLESMKQTMSDEDVDEFARVNFRINQELEDARQTPLGRWSLLDLCTQGPDKVNLILHDGWSWRETIKTSVLNCDSVFRERFRCIGDTIKGYAIKALVQEFMRQQITDIASKKALAVVSF